MHTIILIKVPFSVRFRPTCTSVYTSVRQTRGPGFEPRENPETRGVKNQPGFGYPIRSCPPTSGNMTNMAVDKSDTDITMHLPLIITRSVRKHPIYDVSRPFVTGEAGHLFP